MAEIMSKRPRSKVMRKVEVVADYVDQRDEHVMQALVTVGAFMAVADGQVQVAERDELINFITRQGFVPASSKHDIAEAFDSGCDSSTACRTWMPSGKPCGR